MVKMKKNIFKSPVAFLSVAFLLCIIFAAIFAEFIAPYSISTENRLNAYAPVSKLHFFDSNGTFSFIPFVYSLEPGLDGNNFRKYYENKNKKYFVKFFCKGDSYSLFGKIKMDIHLFGVDAPGALNLAGTDMRGRDLFSRICFGARVSLSIAIIGAFISFFIGSFLGGISGYFGGVTDHVIMRGSELFMMLPGFYILLAVRSAIPPSVGTFYIYCIVVCVISLIGWAGTARVIRGLVLSIRENDFVAAAWLCGAGHLKIIRKHILPHTIPYLSVAVSTAVPGYIMGESALSMLGLGIQEPMVSWGMLLMDSLQITQLCFYPWLLIPGIVIICTILSINCLGDFLRETTDPRACFNKKV